MKKIKITFLLFICLCTITMHAKRAVVMGTISNTKVKTATASYDNSMIAYNAVKQDVAIDKKGNFKLAFTIDKMQRIYLVIDEQQTFFYVEPGDSLVLKINYADFDKSIVFGGNNSEKNNFLKAFEDKFSELGQQMYEQTARRKAASFAYYSDSLLNEKLAFADKITPKPGAGFITDFKTTLIYTSAGDKLHYARMWSYLRRKGDTLPDVPSDYYNFVKKLPLTNEALLDNEAYVDFVKYVVNYYADEISRTVGSAFEPVDKLLLAKTVLKNDKILQVYEAQLAYDALNYSEFSKAEKFYFGYGERNKNSPFSEELKTMYTKIRKISPGQPAPDFTLNDDKGKPCRLSDFKGKVVYLDFWASWCGPCLRELPHSKKLKEAFAGKDVVFLYVSIDEDMASWKEAITKNNISGTHLIAPDFEHPVCKTYDVNGVPTYFLIGRDGKIVNNNPSRPSAEEAVKKEITEALER